MRTARLFWDINMKPRVLVLSGYGLNCEEETAFAFRLAGGKTDIVHMNDLIASPKKLHRYQILAIPGGFSYGDDTGSGNAYARRLNTYIREELLLYLRRDKLMIGICNGFQILVSLQCIFPKVALLQNTSARYVARWVDVCAERTSVWLRGITRLSLPIAHGEGKLYADSDTLLNLKKHNHIAMRYTRDNPTGTIDNIVGLTDKTGRVLGLMPHPERAIFFTQLPDWTYRKELYQRAGRRIPKYGPGLKFFQNAVRYFV